MKTQLTAIFMAFAPLTAMSGDTDDLHIMQPVALETLKTAKTGAGYMIVHNMGDTDDTLLQVKADFPRVMIHDTKITDDGVARMFHVDAINIPAGGMVTFAPGGKHIMFMGLTTQFKDGGTVNGILVFENAGEVAVTFDIVKRDDLPELAANNHGTMNHSEMDHSTIDHGSKDEHAHH